MNAVQAGNSASNPLEAIGAIELLNQDRRPTFIIDLEVECASPCGPLRPLFSNVAMQNSRRLRREIGVDLSDEILQWTESNSYVNFKYWARQPSVNLETSSTNFSNWTWDISTIRGRWNVVSASSSRHLFLPNNHRSVERGLEAQSRPASETSLCGFQECCDSDTTRSQSLSGASQSRSQSSNTTGSPSSTSSQRNSSSSWSTPWSPIDTSGRSNLLSSKHREQEYVGSSDDDVAILEPGYFDGLAQRKKARKSQAAADRAKLLVRIAKQDEEAAANEVRFRRLADMMPTGIFMVDKDRRLIYGNQSYRTMLGVSAEDATTIPWSTMFSDVDLPSVLENWKALCEGRTSMTFEARMRNLSALSTERGEERKDHVWVLISAYPEFHGDGSLKRITGCVTDITRQKLAEDYQMRRVEFEIDSRKQLEAFVDLTSHEQRNPLLSMIHSADEILSCLSDLPVTAEGESKISTDALRSAQEATETILFCAQHSRRIVDDILTLSKLNSKLLHITPVPTKPETTVSQALKMFEGELRTSDIDLETIIDDSLHTVNFVQLDPCRILQILVNLIGNAVKFTARQPSRKITVRLRLATQRPSDMNDDNLQYLPCLAPLSNASGADIQIIQENLFLEYSVEDTGCGISAAGQKQLFNRFSQGSTRTHVKYGGSGLGLFISRQICELQGGQIGFQSTSGGGSTFAFFVKTRHSTPMEVAEYQAKQTRPDSRARQRATPSPIPASNGARHQAPTLLPTRLKAEISSGERPECHILLVEDNLINQRVLSQQLRKRGYIVSIANHGEEALSHIQSTRFWKGREGDGVPLSYVLLDMEMPVMDGMTCVRRIRELERNGDIRGHVPVIAVTANARSEQIDDAKAAGMDDFLSKPFRIDELIAKLGATTFG